MVIPFVGLVIDFTLKLFVVRKVLFFSPKNTNNNY